MSEANKAIVKRLVDEFWNKGNLGVADELFADNYVYHTTSIPGTPRGPEGIKKYAAAVRTAVPDAYLQIDDMVAEGDKVVLRWTFSGTHRGTWRRIAPTGNRVAVTGTSITRFEGGKCVEEWVNADDLGLMQQIGVVTLPE